MEETNTNKMREQLQRLSQSYTPEWNYTEENPDAGSVLGMLIADMMEGSRQRLERVMHKHKIRYLNHFDALIKEPVSAARGYVRFLPVAGRSGMMAVPKGTELSAETEENQIIFETMHDICLADSGITSVLMTDGRCDRIVFAAQAKEGERLENPVYKAFDCHGENSAGHTCFLGFAPVLDGINELNLTLRILAEKEEEAVETAGLLASSKITLSIAEPQGENGYRCIAFDRITQKKDTLELYKADYTPVPATIHGYEGYFLVISAKEGIPDPVMSGVTLGVAKEELLPDTVKLEGIDSGMENFSPFGVPLQLMSECSIDSVEAFSKKGAKISVSFALDYELKEEKLEIPEVDIEYKAIMKKPPEAAYAQPVPVCADRVVWEYLSEKGWKVLPEAAKEEALFNGEKTGEIHLDFICPQDMVTGEADEPRLRLRLMQAENIYKVPAVYKCPVIRHLRLSYSYDGRELLPQSVYTVNNYQERECGKRFLDRLDTHLFYQTERPERCMYLCFDESIQGLPFSLYFELENYSDLPIDFTVEYSRSEDFKPIRIVDGTNGFLNSGVMQFLISSDMEKRTLFGKEGYFLRFVGYEKEYPDYRLPRIKNIYCNVAKVENRSTSTEYFYIDEKDEALTVKLKNENLRQLSVWIHEENDGKAQWVEWHQNTGSYEHGRVYQADMAEGTISFLAFAFSDITLSGDGPQIKTVHRNYKGEEANLPENTIVTMQDGNRFVSEVSNPFPTYGGYDAYTEETTTAYIAGILRSRKRAVTQQDILDILKQVSYSVIRIRCELDVDALGNARRDTATVAVLTKDYDKGSHIFQELREKMRNRLEETGSFLVLGRRLQIIQPHFLKVNVRVWLEKDTMENAYDLQNATEKLICDFIDPIHGGLKNSGWQIGSFPRVSQLWAYLRRHLKDAVIARMMVTTWIDDKEVEIKEELLEVASPFILPVNGEHVIHIDLR